MGSIDLRLLPVIGIAFVQGAMDFHALALFYHYKDELGVSAGTQSLIQAFVIVPWSLKPLVGALSDKFPLCGSRRKSYLLVATGCELLCLFGLSTLPRAVWAVAALQLLSSACLVFRNVIGEAIVVERSRDAGAEEDRQRHAQQLVSLFFGARSLGSLAFSFLGGYALHVIAPAHIFRISAGFSAVLFLLVLAGYNEERGGATQPLVEPEKTALRVIARRMRAPAVRNLLVIVCLVLANPSMSSALGYYYTDVLGFGPEQMGLLSFVANLSYLLGIIIFNLLFKSMAFRPFYIATNGIIGCFGFATLALLLGLHRRAGVPDFAFVLLVSSFGNFLTEINFLPVLALGCRICPRGLEATTYALFTALLNSASYVAGLLGSVLVYALEVQRRGFDNLWVIAAVQIGYSIVVTAALFCVDFGAIGTAAPQREKAVEAPQREAEALLRAETAETLRGEKAEDALLREEAVGVQRR